MADAETPEPRNTPTQKPGQSPGFCAPEVRRYILMSAILASALGFIDGTIVSIAMPAMRASLDASLAQAQWINNAYLLPVSALILLGGAVGDRFGPARVFGIGIGVFILASILCALAPTPETLIAGRVLKGIGAAVMIPGSLTLIAKAYPRESRGRAIGIWAAASALTTALGPILGGLALSLGGPEVWRLLFALNLPLGLLALWPLWAHHIADTTTATRRLDMPGAVLVTVALGAMAWGLTGGAAGPAWTTLGLGAGVFALFLLWETRAPEPMVPLSLFADRTFAAANFATFLIYFALSTVLFFLPMTLIAGWGLSEALTSVVFAPLSVFISLLSARAGGWADIHGPGRLIGVGGLLVALSFAVLALGMRSQDIVFGVFPATILMGFGMSLVVAPLSTAIMASVPEDRAGTASGINNAVSRVAGLIAVAVMGSLASLLYANAGGQASFGAFAEAPGHADAMVRAFATLCWITAAITALGALAAWIVIPAPQSSVVTNARR